MDKKEIEKAIGYKLREVKTTLGDCWQVCFNSDVICYEDGSSNVICYQDGDEPVVYIAVVEWHAVKDPAHAHLVGGFGMQKGFFRVFNDSPFGVRHSVQEPSSYYSMIVDLDGLKEAVEEISCRLIEDDKLLDQPITLRKLFDALLACEDKPNCPTDDI